ncbi:MAG: hypothetical protein FJZ95_04655 [Chloroflexi bacterium]|nr:hypothetical protein [Chloroflexota bacterium]
MIDIEKASELLNRYIRPQSFPVAVKMLHVGDELPPKARLPLRDLGSAITLCQGIAMARRNGWTVAIGRQDQCCPHGAFVMGFVPGKGYIDGSCAEAVGLAPKERFAATARHLSRLEPGKYACMVSAPLHRAAFQPDVLVIYGNPAQISRLVQASVVVTGGVLASSFSEGIACSAMIARPIASDSCQVVLAGAGDRCFALTQDHEMAFAIPSSKVESILQGLELGHEFAGHRYPTPFAMRLEGQLPQAYYRFLEMLNKEE